METIIKNKIKEYKNTHWFQTLASRRAFIAGGALTSALTDKKINDFDVYFRTQAECDSAINYFNLRGRCVATTDNAITYELPSTIEDTVTIQLIRAEHLINQCVYDTIRNFDFTINMAAYDMLSDNIIAHVDFYKHNMQRKLVFNDDTLYPIISMHRAIKYINRGYTLSGHEQVKIALAINNLKMKDYTDLKKQLLGIDTSHFIDLTTKLMANPNKEYNYQEVKTEMKGIMTKNDSII